VRGLLPCRCSVTSLPHLNFPFTGSHLSWLIWSSELGTGGVPDDEALRAIWAGLEAEGRARVASWFGGAVETRRAADMRYGEQVFVIGVPLDGVAWDGAGLAGRVRSGSCHSRRSKASVIAAGIVAFFALAR
jgi:hypothetical protein